MVLIYGDLINSRSLSVKKTLKFWDLVEKQNLQQSFVVPFYICLGDAFHGIVDSPEAAKEWINNFRQGLKKLGIIARYAVVPVRGDFSKINTPRKYEKVAHKRKHLVINPLNIPELVMADKAVEKIKKSKKDQVVWLKKPSLKERNRNHKTLTLEYLK